ncbi:linear gramicidin synthase subunit C [Janthinobacterium sp. HH01]|uniref:non-ribosomal peptide synthase/polyketide synthase n=1 Tax=Janthinobacterium sp. HH01 TaxID=1198452 RepID=UPI0002AE92A7|nr:non-ribosomal peptide synthase/polyketide synthase [Janthinobacterium sp. HH01]ELX07967.1 linear gramicidin synthase subunit C [Janthinobacterium sp. HH01]
MNVVEFLSELRQVGVTIVLDQDELVLDGSTHLITDDLVEKIRGHKQLLVDFLKNATRYTPIIPTRSDPCWAGNIPLSFAQQRLWFIDQLEPGSAFYNIPAAVRLSGALDVAALRRTVNEIVRRHEALRTSFGSADGAPVQVIAPVLELALEAQDLSELPQAEREAKAQWLVQDEAQTPFDLANGPLIRARLLRLSETEHIVLLTVHHIVSDGWSTGVLVQEVAALYAAFVEQRPSPLPELPIQYADFAHWQRQWLSGDVLQRQLDYWQQQLGGAPTLLTLPTDRPRPAQQSHRGAVQGFALSPATTAALNTLSRQAQSTLFMTLTAAFNVLLSRYAGQDDICIGTPIANRNRAETEGLIGFFVNTLVLRTRVDADAGFLHLLEQVRLNTLDAYAHQDVPFEQLVDVLKPERHLSHSALFQVMLSLQNTPMGALTLPGLTMQGMGAEGVSAKFDLTLNLMEGSDRLVGSFEYNTDLFDQSTIARMAEHFVRLLDAVVADPACPVGSLPMLGEQERRLLLEEWNRSETAFPLDRSYASLFAERAAAHPERIAAVCGDESLSYGELDARTRRLAAALIAAGAGTDTVVVLVGERNLALLAMMIGVLRAGAAFLPLEVNHPVERLREIVAGSRSGLALVSASGAAVYARLADGLAPAQQVLAAEEIWLAGEAPELAPLGGPDDLAYVISTSGTTGVSKGAMVEQRGMLNNMFGKQPIIGLHEGDRIAQSASAAFDIAVWQFLAAPLVGATTCILPDDIAKDPQRLPEAVDALGITLLEVVPSLMRSLLEASAGHVTLATLRWVLPTGEALPLKLAQDWFARFPSLPLMNVYGPAECSDDVAYHAIHASPEDGAAIPIGRPTANNRLYILDARLQMAPIGVAGEICVAGAGVGRGYLNDPVQTEKAFVAHPFEASGRLYRTGDVGRYRADGVMEFIGRIDNQVKVRGFRIELGEIETALSALESLRDVLVMAREVNGDKRLVAYLVAHEGAQVPPVASLRTSLLETLPEYMVPAHFVTLDQLPLTPNGKVDRKALPAPELSRGEDDYVAPRTAAEEIMAGIWASVLKLEQVGMHDNFFALGGHSLLATQLVSQIRGAFEVELPLRVVFEAPTAAGLLARMESEQRGLSAPPMAPVGRDVALPLSFAQQRLWFIDQFESASALYNIPAAVRLSGALDVAALRRTVNEIVRRHEALRTSFASADGTPVQVIAPVLELALEAQDLSELPQAEREAKAQWLVQDEAQTPFDLSNGPLIRARLLRLSETEHIVLLTVHHIVSDGWSTGILVQEVAALYAAYVEQRPSPLPELPIQYADFAHWQRQWLSGEVLQQQLNYWQGQLGGAPTLLTLPTDRPRPAQQSHRGAVQGFAVSAATTAALNTLSRQAQSTLFMTLTAVFNVLLSRYAGQDDICIGTPIANRNRAETEGLIGFFVNTLVLRTQVDGGEGFLQLLDQVRVNMLDAYAHQDVPFEQLVEVLKPERHVSHSPLFQVMLVLQNAPMEALTLPGLTLRGMGGEAVLSKFDMSFNISEEGGRLLGGIEYNTDLFDQSTMVRMAGHFVRLLEAVVADPQRRIQDLDMLDEAERRQLLVEWNDTASGVAPSGTIHALFEQRAAASPESVALEYEDASLTYGELNARANRLAHHLRTLGVGPDVLVGLCVERSLEMIVGLLAILKAGGAYVPLDPAYPADRLAYMLEDASPAVLLTQQRLLSALPASDVPVFLLDADAASLDVYDATNPSTETQAGNLAYVIYTSGSTGRPKGVAVSHASLNNLIAWHCRTFELSEGTRSSTTASIAFDACTWEVWPPLCSGGSLILPPHLCAKDPEYLLNWWSEARLDVSFLTTPLAEMAMARGYEVASLRHLLIGGDALRQRPAAWPAFALVNNYGPTENTVVATSGALRATDVVLHIGRPIANTQIHILDTGLNPVPVGVAGELHIAGDGLARGYVNRGDLTADKFIPNPFGVAGSRMYKSGDLARYLEDGSIEYLGRIDHQVKLRGFRIELGEIEAALAALEPVREALVLAREDVAGDKRLVAYLVAHENSQMPETEGLRAALLASLPEYMVPAHFVVLEQMPLTPNGKVDRKALPAPDIAHSEDGYVAPRTAAEEIMAGIWAGVLNLEQVGVHANFFTLGGHSLLAITLVERMRRAGLNVDVRTLFASPTIAALADAIGAAEDDIVVPANGIVAGCTAITPEMLTLVKLDEQEIARVVAAVPGGGANIQDIYPLAPLQEGILFHHMMNEEGDAYLLPHLMQFDSGERLDGFVSALNMVIARHDILRTALHWEGLNEAVQVVWREAKLVAEQVDLDDGVDAAKELAERYHPRHYRLDVRQAPLLRAFVAQDKANGRWLLQILAHHLAIDHSTLDMLVAEVRMLLQGRADELAPALPFRNFVAQARLGVSQAEHEAYFSAMLADVDEPTAPFGLLDVQGDGTGIVQSQRMLDGALAQRLRRQARQLGVSAASVMHLAWAQVLAKVSGRDDVVFGTVLLGRMAGGEDASSVLGMFINTLPVRFKLGGRDVAGSVRAAHDLLTRLLRHEHASLALAQRCSGVRAPMPLFSSLLNYRHSVVHQAPAAADADSTWQGVSMLSSEERSNYPFTLSIDDLGQDFALTVQVDATASAQRVVDYMQTVLEQLVLALEEAPDSAVGGLGILPPAELHRTLVEWNNTASPGVSVGTIHALFEQRAAASPESVALEYEDASLTYGELNARANRLAHHLRTLGVGPDVLVGLCVERSLEMIVGLLAILKAGGAYVPLDPAYPADRLAYMLEDAAPAVLLTQQHLLSVLPASDVPVFLLDADAASLDGCDPTNPSSVASAGNLAYVIYTSGSTGRPKGTLLSHGNLCHLAHAQALAFGVGPAQRVLQFASLNFDASTWEIFMALAAGATLCLAGREQLMPGAALESTLQKLAINHVTLPPVALGLMSSRALAAVETLIVAGEACSRTLVDEWAQERRFFNAYGPTEATVCASVHHCLAGQEGQPPIGTPIANVQLYILDAGLEPVPVGVAGELHIAGAGLARGYLNRGDLTADRFIPNPFGAAGSRLYKSGDLARYLEDGSIEYLGRIDHQVKLRGFRIELGEIEAALAALEPVRETLVLAREDVAGDKRLVAYLVAHDGEQLPDAAGLRAALLETLPEYMVPAHFVVLEQMPLTSNGKVDRKALPVPELSRSEDGYVAPRTAAEEIMAGIWAGVLKLDKVGLHDDFFALGGHSLLATQLVSQIRSAFEVELPLRAVFEAPTIAGLMPQLDAVLGGLLAAPMVPVGRDAAMPLSFAQQRLWFIDQLEPGSGFYNIPLAVRLSGALDVAALRRTVNEIVRRHEALRTSFGSADGAPVQVIAPVLELALEAQDLSDLPQAEREAKAQWLVQDEAQTPFDLANGPLIRARLLRLSETEHIVLLTVHHIVSDGWSTGVLVQEVAALYAAFAEQRPSPLPELPIQYADFAHWQRQWLSGEVLQRQLDYWQQQLGGAPTLLTLPTDRPRPAQQSHRGAVQGFALSPATTAALNTLSRQAQSTLFMTLTAAFNVLLSRYAGQDDICIGTPIANRNRAETEGLIGFFVNTLVLRTRVDADAGFLQLLEQVRGHTLDAYAHQDVPFEQLVDVLNPERHLSHSALFQVMLSLQNTPMGALTLPGLTMQGMGAEGVSAKFDLTLNLMEGADRLVGSFEYNTDLFDQSTIARMAEHFVRLLDAVVADPACPVGSLPMLGEQERRLLLEEWNRSETAFPLDRSYASLFAERAAAHPERIAAVCGDESLSYGELDARTRRLAAALIAAGAGTDTVVVLVGERNLALLAMMIGVLRAGAAFLPLEVNHPVERLREIVAGSRSGLALVSASGAAVYARLADGLAPAQQVLAAEEIWLAGEAPELAPLGGPDDLAYVISTSGTTGVSKGAMVEQRGMLNNMFGKQPIIGLHEGDRIAQSASAAFDIAVWQFLAAPLVGATTCILPDDIAKDPQRLPEAVDALGITLLEVVPSLMRSLLEASAGHVTLATLRWVLPTGEALPLKLAQDWFARFPSLPLMNVYGPAECSDDVAYHAIHASPEDGAAIPIGRPTANNRLYILDARLQMAPIGVAGEICVAGAGVGRGYLNDPAQTEKAFVAHPFEASGRLYRTGDVGRYRADGVMEFIGRIDNQVKVRGFRIELGEIETALSALESLRDVLVMAREVNGDKRLVAYLVAHEGAQVPPVASLRTSLLETLPEYMVPAHFVTLDQLPLTPNGKVDRKALPAPDLSRGEDDYVAPRTAAEEIMAGIWASVLKVEQVGMHDNFFALGGHSLLATQLVSQIRGAFEVELPLRVVFEAPTAAGLLARMESEQRGLSAPPMAPVGRDVALPLSFAQQRLWFIDQFESASALYNIPAAVRLSGALDVAALRRTVNEIVRRHEALRTSFASVDGTPVQVIAPVLELALEAQDLSALPQAEREAKAQWLVQDEAQTPFDLANGPLIRARLLRLSETEHIVLLTVHHIVSDGWSTGILVQEVAALYAAYVEQRPSPLPELPIQYADFAHWQRQWLSGEVLQQQLNYWQGQLGGAPTLLTLPTDRPRPAQQSHRGAVQGFAVSAATTAALNTLSRQAQSTLFMTLTAVFNVLLSRYAGQDDICIGTPIANRNRAETEGLIGFFVNTLVLRTQVDGGEGFLQLLDQVRVNMLDAYAHQDVPFEQLVEVLKPERHVSHSPLFQVMLVLQNAPTETLTLPGLTLRGMGGEAVLSKFDMSFNISEEGGRLLGGIEYNTDLFDQSTMARMAGHFVRLLEAVVADPQRRIQDLDMLDAAERHQLLVEWNDTASAGVSAGTIHALFEQRAAASPESVALEYEDASLTYGELNARANRLAHHLRTLGVGPDVLVGLCVERSLEMIVGLLAILKAGGAYVPLDPAYPPDRLAYMLEDAAPAVLLTQQRLLSVLPASDVPVFLLDADAASLDVYDATNPSTETQAGNLAYVIYTSGSTGRPKGTLLSHANLCHLAHAQALAFGVGAAQRVLQFASLNFDASTWEIFMALAAGATLCLAGREQLMPGAALESTLQKLAINHVTLPPVALGLMSSRALAAVETLIVAGEACSRTLVDEWAQERRFFNAYGPTEATVCASVHHCLAGQEGQPPIGTPIANVQLYILDAGLEPVPVGAAGELHIAGAGLARGYLNRGDLTADRFIPNPFGATGSRMYKSGDLARYLEDGSIEYLGRIDHQVKLRGFRIELGEIEAALAALEPVREAMVLAREDVAGDKRLVAYLVAHDGAPLPDAAGLRAALLESLPEYMVPAHFVVLEQMPLTPNGKVDRKALPVPELVRSEDDYVGPRTPTEDVLNAIWLDMLKLDRIGIFDDFFLIGGHSLLAAQLLSRVKRVFNVEIPLRDFFAAPSQAGLAALLDQQSRAERQPSSLVLVRPGAGALPLFLTHPNGGEVHYAFALAPHIDSDVAIYGLAAYGFLEGETPFTSVEAMAAHYIAAIREVQAEGPYRIAGYSSGGVLAYEMAHQLVAGGEEVEFLGLLDSHHDPELREQVYRTEVPVFDDREAFLQKLTQRLPEAQHALLDTIAQAADLAAMVKLCERFRLLPEDTDPGTVRRYLAVEHEGAMAVINYVAPPLSVPTTLFRAEEGDNQDPHSGWAALLGNALQVVPVGGSHLSIIQPPHVAALGAAISSAIRRLSCTP